jgi:uncharacterized protein involved in response to NO
MSLRRYLLLPAVIAVIGVVYWLLSHDPLRGTYDWAGAAMLVVFAAAMAVMGFVLIPTLDNVGPTAPVDEDWHERGH